MKQPKILDLFSGPGGASAGYHAAGLDVTGVDTKYYSCYPYTSVIDDALQYLEKHHSEYDCFHASPPCQAFSQMINSSMGRQPHVNLIPETRYLLEMTGKPYIIENVPSAPIRRDLLLCGKMFDMQVIRHRYFETNIHIPTPTHKPHVDYVAFAKDSDAMWRDAAGLWWIGSRQARQAIPPTYTEYIGKYLLAAVK